MDARSLAEEVIARCQKLASFSEDRGSTRRTFLSSPMHDCHREIRGWMEPLGAQVWVDTAGNLRGFYPAANPEAPRLAIGSHLDTVPNAGAYDGILGVVLAISLLNGLRGKRLPFGIEVVGFSEEEGVRFGTPFIGSRALIGRLDDELLDRQDVRGISVRRAIEAFGLNPAEVSRACLREDTIGFVEFHIEQGPVLENLGLPLGVVEAVVGQSRLEVRFGGRADHAGTTPMNLRRDALAAAAEWIGEVERFARDMPGLVATVGSLAVRPGATNVVAAEARASLDARHGDDSRREQAVDALAGKAEDIARRRGVSAQSITLMNQRAVAMDPFLVQQVESAVRKAGCEPHRMVSGAGHDAMILAERFPAAMVFLRTPGGISHNPAESVEVEDVARAFECGLHLLDQLAASSELSRKGNRA
jgi:allantoate deiminase